MASPVTIYSAAGDGIIRNAATGSTQGSWTTLIGAATGTVVDATTATQVMVMADNGSFADGKQYCDRQFYAFDTSTTNIPSGAVILSAKLGVYLTTITSTAGGSVNVFSASQASTSTLALGDFGSVGSTAYATAINFAALTLNAYNEWTLNATGLAALNTSGYTKLCLRSSFDSGGTVPTSGQRSEIDGRNSEFTGTSSDPYLIVTYAFAKTFTADMVVNPPRNVASFTADMDISSNRTTKTFTADLTIARVSVTGDTFLEPGGSSVNLSSHTPSGPVAAGTWSSHPASGISSVVAASSGKYVAQDVGTSIDLNSATPSTADYEVEATVTVMATAYSCGVLARWDTTATTGYTAFIDTNNTTGAGTGNKLVIGKHVAGTFTVIGTPYNIGTLTGPYRLRLRCSGTSISAWLDGTQRVSVTDSSISAVGKAGLRVTGTGNTTSFRLSDFAVYTGFTNTTTAAFTADMVLVDLTKTKTFTADLVIRGAVTKTFTASLGVGNRITATSSSQSGAAQTAVSDTGAADSLNYNAFPGLCRMPNGNLLLAYHAGNDHTGSTNCKIKARIGANNGDGTYTWGTETTLATSAGSNLADVGCITLANNDVMVTWNDSSTPGAANINTLVDFRYRKSSDNGATWATTVSQAVPGWATTVTAGNAGGAYAIAPGKPVQIPAGQANAGRLLLATYGWDDRVVTSFNSHEYVKCMASDDNGATWTQLSTIFPDTAGTAYDETDLLVCDDGSVLAACRQITGSGTGYNIITRRSGDGGASWNTATIVLGTSSSTGYGGRPDLVETGNGGILMRFRYMNAGSSSWTGYRLSTDRGQSWAAPDVDPYDGTTGRTGTYTGAGRGPDIYGAFAPTAAGSNTVAYAWCEETNPGTGTRCIIYFRVLTVAASTTASFTADMVIASSTATQTTKTFTASLQVVIIGAVKTFTASMVINPAVIPATSTYARPFTAALDVQSVTAPLDVQAVTAPLDMTTEAT